MSRKIIQFVQDLLENINIPVHFVTPPCNGLTWLDKGLRDALPDADYNELFTNKWFADLHPKTIYQTMDTFHSCYTVLCPPGEKTVMICGPVLLEEITPKIFSEIARNMGVPDEALPILKNYYMHLPAFSSPYIYQNIFTTLGDTLWGKDSYRIEIKDFNAMDKWYESHKINQASFDAERINIPLIETRYSLEGQVLEAVAKGNEQKALKIVAKLSASFSPFTFINSLRDHKDYLLAFNTLARKKAEEAGIHPVHLDLYSAQNRKAIEEITVLEQCHSVLMQMVHGYCLLINTYKRADYSLLTQKVIAYVDTDLTADLSLKSMSELLSVNASYLSTLFRKEVGIPLTDYVNRQRIDQAKKLLIITDLPSKMIAQECGICDVYYFNRLFKKITGYTPKVYRENATREHEPAATDAP